MNTLRLLPIAFLLLCAPLHGPLIAQWVQTNGPYGGYISALVATDTKLFAGASWEGLFVSLDQGTTWTAVDIGDTSANVAVLAAGPRPPSRPGASNSILLAGTNQNFHGRDGGVYRSTDDGISWDLVSASLGNLDIHAIAFSDTVPFVAASQGLFLSTDGGTTWGEVKIEGRTFDFVYALAAMDSIIFAGGSGGGVYRSTNRGVSWMDVSSGLTSRDVRVLALAAGGAGLTHLFAGTRNGLFRSTDLGMSWSEADSGLTGRVIQSFLVDRHSAGDTRLYLSVQGSGVFRSTDNGTSWTAVNAGLTDADVRALASVDTSIVAGTWVSGVFRSTNHGDTWVEASTGLRLRPLYALVAKGGEIFAGTSGTGVYHTSDRGAHWIQVNTGLPRRDVFGLAAIPGGATGHYLFAGIYGGLLRSSDNGSQWTAAATSFENMTVSAFAALDSFVFTQTSEGVYRSSDEGMTWTTANSGVSGTGSSGFAVIDSVILVGADGVFRSTDHGQSWTASNTGFPFTPNIRAFAVSNGNVFAAMTTGTLFRSSNNGTTWVALDTALTGAYVLSFAVSGQNIFAGTLYDGVFLSTDGGDHWTEVSAGLPGGKASPLAATDMDLYAGTDLGVWRRPLSEMVPPAVHVTPDAVPLRFALEQNYPNPFNPRTEIRSQMSEVRHVKLVVYDLLGREVAVLVDEQRAAGSYRDTFDATGLASGVYIYRLSAGLPAGQAGSFVQSRSMLLLK